MNHVRLVHVAEVLHWQLSAQERSNLGLGGGGGGAIDGASKPLSDEVAAGKDLSDRRTMAAEADGKAGGADIVAPL